MSHQPKQPDDKPAVKKTDDLPDVNDLLAAEKAVEAHAASGLIDTDEAEAIEQSLEEQIAESPDTPREHPENLIERGLDMVKQAVKDEIKLEKDDFEADGRMIKQTIEHPIETVEETGERIKNDVEEIGERVEEAAETVKDAILEPDANPYDKVKLPWPMKVLGVLSILAGVITTPAIVFIMLHAMELAKTVDLSGLGTSSIVVAWILMGILCVMAFTFILFGISMLRNRRRFAAMVVILQAILIAAGIICDIMLFGIGWTLVFFGIVLVILIALQSYLDPSLADERKLRRKLRNMEMREEAEEGTLGYDTSGKGYITLNFYNLFWIFTVSSILGLIVETVFHMVIVDPGVYQDRAGMLYGPFSPIYGFGALLMTVFLNRFHDRNFIVIFFVSALIGGAFEYFVSWFMQVAFGVVAWDYTGMWLSIGGRTCGIFMIMWGFLGLVWIKVLLPILLQIINLIPWNWRYIITTICAALMVIDGVMTLMALDCWYERVSGEPVVTPIQKFCDQHFDNTFMTDRFQSMTIHPDDALRTHQDAADAVTAVSDAASSAKK